MSNPSLGTIDCPTCGAAGADVRQTRRKGARLYWQCADCGLNQPTGAKIQERLWRDTAFKTGAQPIRPSNVTAELPANTPAEFDPNEPEPTEHESENKPTTSRARPGRGVAVVMLGALGLGALLATR
ncbi:hypothetical protein [Chromohalobacter israelensis]|uniref:hypothetical protein n=1 Tax=Chromohalobacter israelensis TaxID=141390 RepID=UPI00265C5B01|nr:hypothetical protein [Chromohalobacter salexigens]MDO0946642.1 hypothetical protein [Chromohalobacter salexigens]